MNLNIKFLFFILLLRFTSIAQMQVMDNNVKQVHEKILNLIQNRPEFFYSKIATSVSSTGPEFSADIKLSTRVSKDSLIFANVNYMGIQAASAHLTHNKGYLLNRFSKCYLEGDAALISEFTGVDLGLLEMEELILGLPIYYTKLSNQNIESFSDSLNNLIVTFSGNVRTDSTEQKQIDLIYTFDDSLTYLKQLNLSIPSESLNLVWKCEEFQDVSGFRLPSTVLVNIKSFESVIELNLKYNSVEINVPEVIEFEIPESYEKCK